MENEKKVVKLDEEQLEQVAGGWGSTPYSDCFFYQELLRSKNNDPEEVFRDELENIWNNECGHWKEACSCRDCPVYTEWRFLYLR